MNKFHLAYAGVLKANMDNLEKRNKKAEEVRSRDREILLQDKQGVQKGKISKPLSKSKPTAGSPPKKAVSTAQSHRSDLTQQ